MCKCKKPCENCETCLKNSDEYETCENCGIDVCLFCFDRLDWEKCGYCELYYCYDCMKTNKMIKCKMCQIDLFKDHEDDCYIESICMTCIEKRENK